MNRAWAQPGGQGGCGAGLRGGGGGLSSQSCRSIFFPVPPLLPGFLSSPLRLAGCVLRPVPGTASHTRPSSLRTKESSAFSCRSRHGRASLHPPGQGPSSGLKGHSFLATPQPLKKGRQSPQREGPGLLQAPPQGSRSRDWLVRGRGDGSAVPCVTGGGPPLHPWPQFPHPQSRSSHRCPAQL